MGTRGPSRAERVLGDIPSRARKLPRLSLEGAAVGVCLCCQIGGDSDSLSIRRNEGRGSAHGKHHGRGHANQRPRMNIENRQPLCFLSEVEFWRLFGAHSALRVEHWRNGHGRPWRKQRQGQKRKTKTGSAEEGEGREEEEEEIGGSHPSFLVRQDAVVRDSRHLGTLVPRLPHQKEHPGVHDSEGSPDCRLRTFGQEASVPGSVWLLRQRASNSSAPAPIPRGSQELGSGSNTFDCASRRLASRIPESIAPWTEA